MKVIKTRNCSECGQERPIWYSAIDGHHLTKQQFIVHMDNGAITDSDGFGVYAYKTMMSDWDFTPSEYNPLLGFTHVVWFNK